MHWTIFIMDKMKSIFITTLLILTCTVSAQSLDYMGWVDRSAGYIEQNRLDSAAMALQKAMALDPANENNPVLLLNLGIMQRQLEHHDDALLSFTAALSNNLLPEVVLHNRASLLCDMERFDEAMEDYDQLIREYPKNVEAYYRRGLLFLEKNDRTNAEKDFKASTEIDPNNLYTRLSKALLFKLDDNWEAAEKVYSELIQSSKTVDPSFYMSRAECYVNTDQFFRASADLRAIEGSQKDNPYFYILRGRIRLGQYDKVAARADFQQAKKLGYDASIVNDWLKKTE